MCYELCTRLLVTVWQAAPCLVWRLWLTGHFTLIWNIHKGCAAATDLFGVELVELYFLPIFPPQTQDSSLGAVGHVDQLLKPPPVVDHARHASQQQTVVTHLHNKPRWFVGSFLQLLHCTITSQPILNFAGSSITQQALSTIVTEKKYYAHGLLETMIKMIIIGNNFYASNLLRYPKLLHAHKESNIKLRDIKNKVTEPNTRR